MIKPIQTRYKGYNFRSRLEARWAVFFDALGIEWEYEPEGFELPDGTRYLPDFWLPRERVWVEIKGQEPTDAERMKCYLLADASARPVLLLSGTPGVEQVTHDFAAQAHGTECFFGWHEPDQDFSKWASFLYREYFGPHGLREFLSKDYAIPYTDYVGRERVLMLVELDRHYYRSKYGKEHPRWKFGISNKGGLTLSDYRKDGRFTLCFADFSAAFRMYRDAADAARSARFEFGQSGVAA